MLLILDRLIPLLLSSGKSSGTLTTPMVSTTFTQLINCVGTENDTSFLASLYKCFGDSLRTIGGPPTLSPEYRDGIIEATKRQLENLANKRRTRRSISVADIEDDKEELALLEELEEFVLDDMGKLLIELDSNHPLLIAVSGVRDLGLNLSGYDPYGGEEFGEEA